MLLTGYSPLEITTLPDSNYLTQNVLHDAAVVAGQKTADPGFKHDSIWTAELRLVKKDGSSVWTEVKSSLLYNEDNIPCGYMGVARDITARKQSEEELNKAFQT